MTVHPIGTRCDYQQQDDADRISRCPSTNAKFIPEWQGNLCIVHEAAYRQAKAAHPAGKARLEMSTFYDPVEVIKILCDELRTANSKEALEGYFNHLTVDEQLTRSVQAYGGDLGQWVPNDDDDNDDANAPVGP